MCHQWGIDNPIDWMNATEPRILDLWIAFKTLQTDTPENLDATEVFNQLGNRLQNR